MQRELAEADPNHGQPKKGPFDDDAREAQQELLRQVIKEYEYIVDILDVTLQALIMTRRSAERPSLRLTEPRPQPIYLQADGTMAPPPASAPTRDPSPSQPDMELEVP